MVINSIVSSHRFNYLCVLYFWVCSVWNTLTTYFSLHSLALYLQQNFVFFCYFLCDEVVINCGYFWGCFRMD